MLLEKRSPNYSQRIHFDLGDDGLLDDNEEICIIDIRSLARRDLYITVREVIVEEDDVSDLTQ